MRPATEREIRASFVNCTKGEATRLAVPRGLADTPWDDLDFLGWQDPAAPDRTYLVAERGDGFVGVALRRSAARAGMLRRSMCSLCLTTHPSGGVSLMTAKRAGRAGQQGNSVGIYLCTDLACSLYMRGKKEVGAGSRRLEESLTLDEKVDRAVTNLSGFLSRVLD
ncbi:FBP domain-containing protein [Actinocatenispora rupis]|uniref:Elongation factor G-binding protein C-terminal treble-clef zinc-finger domain-containing protein n=1 Tax=Actinocatenispora rupis TaxID=519421 RepID=A0A8J3IXY9_9ACTN|nr:FBP domain-containing protein [Actinocatenispora rupis]GID12116.1 hypothetical protein Aru02nite_30050 [Actinocatenispora rupis]